MDRGIRLRAAGLMAIAWWTGEAHPACGADGGERVLEFPAADAETGGNARNGTIPGSGRVVYRRGLMGVSAVFDRTASMDLPLVGGRWPAEGTFDFWIKPDWDPADDAVERVIVSIGGANGLSVSKTVEGQLALVAGGAGPVVSAGVGLDWRRDEWSHAALTWTDTMAAVHLHGRLRAQAPLKRALAVPGGDRVVLGAGPDGKQGLEAEVERVRLRPRVVPVPELRREIAPGILALPENDDVRLWLRGGANGRPVRFLVDTGSSFSALFRDSALLSRLDLAPAPAGAPSAIRQVARIDLTLDGVAQRGRAELPVLEKPFRSLEEGVYGWHSLRERIWTIDWEMRDIVPASEAPPPSQVQGTVLPLIHESYACLVDQAELRIGDASWKVTVLIDTGDSGGLGFSPSLWKEAARGLANDDPFIEGSFSPVTGFQLTRRYVTDRLSLFGHTLHGVSVGETWVDQPVGDSRESIDVFVGLAALSHFDCVFDGPGRQLRVRPRPAPAARESLNRSGLVLLPIDTQSAELRCHVLDNSPAWKLGLRDGDIPLSLDGRPMPDWRATPPRSLRYQERLSAGEAIRFTVRRGGEELTVPPVDH